jgi:hypothetical protein
VPTGGARADTTVGRPDGEQRDAGYTSSSVTPDVAFDARRHSRGREARGDSRLNPLAETYQPSCLRTTVKVRYLEEATYCTPEQNSDHRSPQRKNELQARAAAPYTATAQPVHADVTNDLRDDFPDAAAESWEHETQWTLKAIRNLGHDDEVAEFETIAKVTTRQKAREMQHKRQGLNSGQTILPQMSSIIDWSPSNLATMQRSDDILRLIIEHLEKGTRPAPEDASQSRELHSYLLIWESLTLIDSRLYRKWYNAQGLIHHLQFVVPCEMKTQILERVHKMKLCHARSFDKHVASISSIAYWFQYKRDIRTYINSCIECAKTGTRKMPHVGGISCKVKATHPNEVMHMDICGPFKNAKNGGSY